LEGRGDDAEAVKRVVGRVTHASLQTSDAEWLKKQMPKGAGPVFSIYMQTATQARCLPSKLRLFDHATSLGGVESLIEWRRMSDASVDERLLRVSVGVENWEDLKADFLAAFGALAKGEEGKGAVGGEIEGSVQVGLEGARVEGAGEGAV
jgi:cystathionine gamma-synthase